MQIKRQLKIDRALELAQRGFAIFPVKEGSKDPPLTKWGKGGDGERATTDPSIIRQWWKSWPNANIAIATGPSNLLVVDVDVKDGKDGGGAFLKLDLMYAPIPMTLTVRTPSGGWHSYFRVKVPVGCRTNLLKDQIGEGIDIRSEGGYVVAPGSELPTGVYEYEDPNVPIAAAPQELLDVINQEQDPSPGSVEPGRFSPEQLEEMLTHLDPTEYRDHGRWFQIMCACHHATQGEGCEEFVAWSTSDPWYSDHDEIIRYRWGTLGGKSSRPKDLVTEATLVQHVREAGGVIPGESAADDFPPLPDLSGGSKRFLTLEEIKHLPLPTYLIYGFIPEESLVVLFGAPGTYKTFLALHAVLCVANGTPFFDRPVMQGEVFYLAGESPAGFRLRIAAWEQHYGYASGPPPFCLQPGGAVLNQGNEVDKLIKDILAISKSPKLIVIDTLQVYLEGNENSPEHMGAFVRACLKLRDKTKGTVLVIHHLGKDANKGARGHTSLAGSADAMFEMTKQGLLAQLMCRKMKEADDQIQITLEPLTVVVEPDGAFADSLVLIESEQSFNTEEVKIRALATRLNGKGLKVLVEALDKELGLKDSTARRRIQKAIPEGEEKAIMVEGGKLWLDPDPGNSRGGKTIRYQAVDPEEFDVKDPDDSDDLDFLS